jgi:hypothetical protein
MISWVEVFPLLFDHARRRPQWRKMPADHGSTG